VACTHATAATFANAGAVPGSIRGHIQDAGERTDLALLIDLHLRRNHNRLFNRQLGGRITNYHRRRSDLLHAELRRNSLTRLKLVAIATTATSSCLLGSGRQWDVCADIDHRTEHLRDLRAMFHYLMGDDEQQN